MYQVKREDVPSISGGNGKTQCGQRFRDRVYYTTQYRQRRGDIIKVSINNIKQTFEGINAMYRAHGWLYQQKLKNHKSWVACITTRTPATLPTEEQIVRTVDERESVKVLQECIDLQIKKGQDYQSSESNVVQAMHYRRGVDTIYDIMHGKMMRAASLLESGREPNHESLEDTFKDLINYASFAVSYMRGTMDGQNPDHDMFNRPKK